MNQETSNIEWLKKEIELLKREVDLLRREIEYLHPNRLRSNQWQWPPQPGVILTNPCISLQYPAN